MCWQQRVGWVGEGSGVKAGTSSCLHTRETIVKQRVANCHGRLPAPNWLIDSSPMQGEGAGGRGGKEMGEEHNIDITVGTI